MACPGSSDRAGTSGGITVLLYLPPPVSVGHATLAQSFFCLTIIIALVTAPAWRSYRRVEIDDLSRARRLALVS